MQAPQLLYFTTTVGIGGLANGLGIQALRAGSGVITYSATISACEKGQQWMAAVALLREVQQWQLQGYAITYDATISACEKGQQ